MVFVQQRFIASICTGTAILFAKSRVCGMALAGGGLVLLGKFLGQSRMNKARDALFIKSK
jgi:putative intracellular protease/amidase